MSVSNNFQQVAYGLSQPLINVFAAPIVSSRAPTTADKAPIGTLWIEPSTQNAWILVQIANNLANWSNIEGGAGDFSSITVTTGPNSILGTTNINNSGSGVTTIGTGGTGAVNIGNATGNTSVTGSLGTTTTLTAGTGITATTGNIVATAGQVNAGTTMTAGTGITATTGNIVATAGAVNAGTSMTATSGNITATNGNIVLSAATTGITLPGPTRIINGAGVPANGLAVNVGDIYVNTTAASATTRIYVATAAGTWTNITCAA